MTPRESATLMGFPQTWRLPKGSRVGQRAVGNALCVAMSKAIVEAALSIAMGVQMPTMRVAVETVTAIVAYEAVEEETFGSSRSNKRARTHAPHSSTMRRLRSIEALVKELLRGAESEGGCEHQIDLDRMFDCGCGANDSYCAKCKEPIQCPECNA
jgi:hypothetical protein